MEILCNFSRLISVCFSRLCDLNGPWSAKKRVTIVDLMTHLNDAHDEKLSFDHLTFDNENLERRREVGEGFPPEMVHVGGILGLDVG